MANLENNNDSENKKSVSDKLEDSVQKGVENVQKTVKDATKLASDAVTHPVETAQEFGKQAAKDVQDVKWWAKVLLYLFYTSLFLGIAFFITINLNVTKQWAANQALGILNEDFKSEMSTESVDVDYFGDVTIKGLRIKDYKGLEFIKARQLRANSDWIALARNAITGKSNSLSFNGIQLTNADIKVITYEKDSISNFIRYVGLFDNGKPKDPNKPPFQLDSRVELIDSKVTIVNQNHKGDAGSWLKGEHVNLRAPSVKVNGGNVYAQLNNLSFYTERWGKQHYVDTFSGEISMTNEFLSLKDLTFNTDHSLLQGDLKFNLDKETGWQDFTNKVSWDMTLKPGSQLSGYDISYFVTNWDNYKPMNFSGSMVGPLNKFTLTDFKLGNRQVNIRTSKMDFTNLLRGNFIIRSQSLNTDFTYKDLKAMMPTFVSEKMKNFADDFGRLKYNGNVSVTPKQVYVQKGSLITGIGQAQISNFYLEDFSTNLPKYRGHFNVKNLNTTVITKSPQVGLISGDFTLRGQSFDVNTMVITTQSKISRIEIMGKPLQNAYLDGTLNHRKYNGLIVVNDPQMQGKVNGLIDFSTKRLAADVVADIQRLNLSYFTNAKESQIISGIIDGKFSMTDINDLTLDANLKNVKLLSGGQTIQIPNADVKSFIANGERTIDVNAPGAAVGKITGRYNLGDLAGMVQNGLGKILVGPEPRKLYRGQNFDLDFVINQGLMAYFMPDLRIPDGAHVSGNYDGNSNNLILNAEVQRLIYIMKKRNDITEAEKALAKLNPDYQLLPDNIEQDSATVENIVVRINTANQEEQINAQIAKASFGNNVFRDITLTGVNENNEKLHIAANFLHGTRENDLENKLKSYAINLNQSTNSAGDYVFQFEPTQLEFNKTIWHIDADPSLNHSIVYRKKQGDFIIENLRLYSDDSSLLVKEGHFKSGSYFELNAEVNNLQISKLFDMTQGGNTMDFKGIANGTLNIKMHEKILAPIIDLTVKEMKMGDKDMGELIVTAKNSDTPNVFDIDARIVSAGFLGNNNLHVLGTVNNNTSSPTLDIKAEMNDFDLAFTQQFVSTVFGNMRGKASGVLSISGPLNNIDYSGDIGLKGFGLKLLFTGVDYQFEDTVVPISKGFAALNDIKLKDGRSNSAGSISGFIQFETLASMGVNLIIRADNLIVLNSTQKDNDLFWGRVYGQGDLFISGPVSGLDISTPNMRALSNSIFTFNSSSTSNVDEFKMLRFLKEDNQGEIVLEERKKRGANMNVDFTVSVDKGTLVNVLVGDDVGDISVRGESKELRFQMARTGNISLNGDYFVDSGTFVSKAVLERTFQIAKGSSIQWDGDAMTPQLDIRANYLRTVTNTGQYLGMGALPPVNVVLTVGITGTLNAPKVALDVQAPDVSSQIKETMAVKMANEDEKVVQFGSILVMNSFNVSNSGGFDIDVGNQLESQGYNMLFKQLGSVLNTISNEFQVDLNYLKGDQGSNTGDRANASVSIALSPRVTIKTGLGVPITKSENTTYDYLSGEGIIEYDWSKKNDGTRLLRMYSKPSNIGLVAGAGNAYANQTYGVGAVYSKSFNRLFKKKNKKAKQDTVKVARDSIQNSPQK